MAKVFVKYVLLGIHYLLAILLCEAGLKQTENHQHEIDGMTKNFFEFIVSPFENSIMCFHTGARNQRFFVTDQSVK